ncbi:MAG: hypothetical protein H6658_00395 [Ardenticatenaceae bacterium]|nr:hypothetical protein [Ardenticatenaceae bacterium]
MKTVMILCTAVLLTLTLAVNLSAQGSGYQLWKEAIHTGGQTATGGSYQVQGTVGQANIDVLQGDSYQLTSGFWHPRENATDLYLPFIHR